MIINIASLQMILPGYALVLEMGAVISMLGLVQSPNNRLTENRAV